MLGALLPSHAWAGPLGQLNGPGPFWNDQGDKSLGGGDVQGIQWINEPAAATSLPYLLPFPFLQFMCSSSISVTIPL